MPRTKTRRTTLTNDTRGFAAAPTAWDAAWAQAGSRAAWLRPERWVRDIMPTLRKREVRDVLDLGCGVGRHAQYFANEGFNTSAIDTSATGVDYARQVATSSGVDIDYRVGSLQELPWADASFDYVLSWQSLYAGNGEDVRGVFDEVNRVLRPGGIFQGTMLSKRNSRYGKGREVGPDTFVFEEDDERAVPHFYVDEQGLTDLLAGYRILSMRDNDHGYAGKNHLEFVAEKIR